MTSTSQAAATLATEPSNPAPARTQEIVPQPHRRLLVASLMLAMFLSAMESTIVATAMPSIVSSLGGFADYTWVFSVFLLTQTATIPLYGKLADLYGRRRVFAAGTGSFILGSLACGGSGTMTQLILARAMQGIGAGAVQPIATTIIGDIFTLRERARMQGWLSSVWAVASIVGPLLGGFIVERLHWEWIFLINVPMGLLAITGVVMFLREPATRSRHAVDYLGAALLMAGVMLLLFALLQGGTAWAWTAPQSLGLFTAALLVLAAFVLRESRATEPIVPLSLFKNRIVAAADACSLLLGGMIFALTTFVPLFVQGALGVAATLAGLTLATMSFGWPTASAFAGRVIMAIGFRRTALLGAALNTLGAALLTFLPEASPLPVGAAIFFVGAGMGFLSTTLIVALQGAVPWSSRGVATASNMFSRQLGSTLWVALLGSVLNTALAARLAALPSGMLNGLGGDQLSVTALLLDPQQRAGLDAATLASLQGALSGAVHVVFFGVLLTAAAGLVVSWGLPTGTPSDSGQSRSG